MDEQMGDVQRAHVKARKVKAFLLLCAPIYLFYTFVSPVHMRLIKTSFHPIEGQASDRAVYGYNSTFTDFLDDHFKRPPLKLTTSQIENGMIQEEDTSPHIWLTQSDQRWINTGTSTLALFIQRLNLDRLTRYESVRSTVLVVLCLDQICIERCKNSIIPMYCYGGYKYTRPPQMPVATWPKIAGLIDTLEFRDAFYVDSDVAFRQDPYPIIESFMEKYDLISSESEAHEHFNTGFFWLKSSPDSINAWKDFALNMREISSHKELEISKLSGSAVPFFISGKKNNWDEEQFSQTNRENFITENNLKVKVLDGHLFKSLSPNSQVIDQNAVYLHTACGDDVLNRVYIAQSLGFWQNLDSYYSAPPQILTIDEMTGSSEELLQMLKVLLVLSHYSDRSFQPPPTATVHDLPYAATDLTPYDALNTTSVVRPIYSTFPLPEISNAINVDILASGYSVEAARFLTGQSTLNGEVNRDLLEPSLIQSKVAKSLLQVVDIDIRGVNNLAELVLLLRSSPYSRTKVIRLTNLQSENSRRLWRYYSLPTTVSAIPLCDKLYLKPSCTKICRWKNEDDREIDVPGGPGIVGGLWPVWKEVLKPFKRMEERRKQFKAMRGKARLSMLEDEEDRSRN